jgi:hypothetical protein
LWATCDRSVVFSGFLHPLNWAPRDNWNIVQSGVKHHQPNKLISQVFGPKPRKYSNFLLSRSKKKKIYIYILSNISIFNEYRINTFYFEMLFDFINFLSTFNLRMFTFFRTEISVSEIERSCKLTFNKGSNSYNL